MQNFDLGQFKDIMDYLSQKLSEGGALTPEEQKIYDLLVGMGAGGLNLTGTPDFQAVYNAFNGLADQATKDEFEKLYGTGIIKNGDGTISFTRPGSIIENFMRKGQSINDGPAMAALSEGLQNYLKVIAQNKFNAMTNAYQDVTPIRAQNIQALTNAGGIASTAIGRRVPPIGAAVAGAGEGGGQDVAIDTSGGPGGGGSKSPSFMDKYGGALLGLLGTAGLGVGGYLLKDWWQNRKPGDNMTPGFPDAKERDLSATNHPYLEGSQGPLVADQSALNMGFTPYMNNPYQLAYPTATSYNAPVDQYWNAPQSFSGVSQQGPSWGDWSMQNPNWNPNQTVYPDTWSAIGNAGGSAAGSSAPSWNDLTSSSPAWGFDVGDTSGGGGNWGGPSASDWFDTSY